MRTLTQCDAMQVNGAGAALDGAEALGATAMGTIAGVVAGAVATPAVGVLVGVGVSDLAGLAFVGINELLGV